jgi:hypothetical protein
MKGKKMATMTFPICELEQSVRVEAQLAHAATEVVAQCANSVMIVAKTAQLRGRYAHLVKKQETLIKALVTHDFTACSTKMMSEMAASLDDLVKDERDMLVDAARLHPGIRRWWQSSLLTLSEQVEHLDSIAESLRMETDPEAMALLSLALEQVAVR